MEKFYLKKRCKPLITTLLLMAAAGGYKSQAQVTITPATDGTGICANKAVGGSDAGYTTLGTIVVSETNATDFEVGAHTLEISAPAGWQFNPSTGVLNFISSADVATGAMTVTASTITVSFNGATSGMSSDFFQIIGIEVQPTTTPAAGSLTATAVTGINGVTIGTDFGVLSTTAAVTPSVSIAATPAGAICAGTNVDFTPTMSDTGSAPTYQWLVNSGVVSIAPVFSSTLLNNGDQVSLVVTAGPGGCYTSPTATSNIITMTVNPLPTQYNVTGGGDFCPGGSGVDVSIANSDIDIDYQLYINGVASGSPIAGTGGAISFGLQTTLGSYNVLGTNTLTGCSDSMNGPVTVGNYALPTVYNVVGGGTECPGGAGFDISLDASDLGITYQLYNGGTAVGAPVAGTGAGISFGIFTTTGTYTAMAVDDVTTCTIAMNDDATIANYPVPTVFNVTGGGGYCIGGTGVTVDLDSSEVGVEYQLYQGAAPIGAAIPGTGFPFSFGLQTTAGDYTVVAMELINSCVSDMNDTATVVVNPLPVVYNVTGGGAYCEGGAGIAVDLDNSEAGVDYQLFVAGAPTGTPVAGTGAAISFGPQTTAGTYTVAAMNTTTTCINDMASSALVTITSTVAPSVSISSTALDTICAGTNITFTATPVNGGALPSFAWSVNGIATGTGPTYSYIPSNGDIVETVLTSSEVCPSPDTAVAVMTMTVTPMSEPTVSINISPNDTVCDSTFLTLTATSTFGGPSAAITWLRNGVSVGAGNTFSYYPTNNDIIFTTLSSDYRCRTTSLAFSVPKIISVVAPVIPTVSLTIQPGVIIGHGESDTLIANVTNGGTNPKYQWYRNGTAIPGETNAMYVNNDFQHMDSISVRVHRDDACALVNFNSVILSVGVGVNDVMFANSDIRVMPNPSTGTFSIKGSVNAVNDPQIAVEITNMLGQVVYSKNVVAKQGMVNEEISLDNSIANGTYLLSMKSGADKKVVRLVVEH